MSLSGSRRWQHFDSALQLAVQRSAHKWSFEDFAECFPLYVKEDKNGASATFNSISDYIEAQETRDLARLFKEYNIKDNIDTLHQIVQEAKDRKASGNIGNDVWREDLQPHAAISARTIPLLEAETKRLRETLASMEEENTQYQEELEQEMKARDETNAQSQALLDKLDHVLEEWSKLPADELQEWAIQTIETMVPTRPS